MTKSAEEMAKDDPAVPSDHDRELIFNDRMRFWLMSVVESPEIAAKYNNNVQALAEAVKYGIPVFFSTNPRAFPDAHSDISDNDVSCWPTNLGLGATFDPALANKMATIVSQEYRHMGITMELGPEVDLASDPRWNRFNACYGSDEKLNADLARAVVDGLQTSEKSQEIENGWGRGSVAAMCKHWPGSTGEGGRESHNDFGKYTVYPGNNLDKHIYPWSDGAFKLNGPTKQSAAVMSCYDLLWNIGEENTGASFNKYIIDEKLHDELNFDGFVCTDFWITGNINPERVSRPARSAWGVNQLSPAERALREWECGIDQLGGTNEIEIVRQAYELAVKKHGQNWADEKMNQIARRMLTFGFRVGTFDNPYVDPKETASFVGSKDFRAQGYEAYRKSIVMLKNSDILPVLNGKVYIAPKTKGGIPDRGGNVEPIHQVAPISKEIARKYVDVTDDINVADYAIVFMDSPQSGTGYDNSKKEFIPISLQYREYKAVDAREVSIAGDVVDGVQENRSYKDKIVKTYNEYDLDNLIAVKEQMKNKPVIVVYDCTLPCVPSEFEPYADAVIMCFGGTPREIIMEAITGKYEPSGLLPFQMPENMSTVEKHFEDTPRDMKAYVDVNGNCWDFAYGMNWSGVIDDERVRKYK